MQLRPETRHDVAAVQRLHRLAFGDHGGTVAALVAALRPALTRDQGLSLLAERDGRVVGHVLFTRSLLDAPRCLVPIQVLSPLAVLPQEQRRGIGSALVRTGLEVMEERGVPVVFLEGSPAYYGRFGFLAGAGCGFRRPSLRIPPPAFQALRLAAWEPWMTGTLVYSQPFWEHDSVGLREASRPPADAPADDGAAAPERN
jgi:putative acetyltransferase